MGKRGEQLQGTRVKNAVWAQEGRISGRGSYRRRSKGIGTAITVWGRRERVAPERVIS
jgi:hypothetical protein